MEQTSNYILQSVIEMCRHQHCWAVSLSQGLNAQNAFYIILKVSILLWNENREFKTFALKLFLINGSSYKTGNGDLCVLC